jgi:hypothetical protein
MQRKLIAKHPFFSVEQCSAENVRIYRVQGLRLYDEQEERNDGPVIELVRSLPGVEGAAFEDSHTFIVRRALSVTWEDAEPRIADLLDGVAACSQGLAEEQHAEVAVAIPLRATQERLSK